MLAPRLLLALPLLVGLMVADALPGIASDEPALLAVDDAAPQELGRVRWLTDVDAALADAAARRLPLAVLFQELPGCARCLAFGGGPLQDALVVEALSTAFVTLHVNTARPNESGRDLARFGVRPFSAPQLQVFDADGEPLGDDSVAAEDLPSVARLLARALRQQAQQDAQWLELSALQALGGSARRTTLVTSCFWEGEAHYGGLPGVVDVRAAWRGGHEVVEVHHLTEQLGLDELLDADLAPRCVRAVTDAEEDQAAAAARQGLAVLADAPARPALARDHLFDLRGSRLRALPLTPLQAIRVNAAVSVADAKAATLPESIARWLSPRQRELAEALWSWPLERVSRLGGPELLEADGDLGAACAEVARRLERLDR